MNGALIGGVFAIIGAVIGAAVGIVGSLIERSHQELYEARLLKTERFYDIYSALIGGAWVMEEATSYSRWSVTTLSEFENQKLIEANNALVRLNIETDLDDVQAICKDIRVRYASWRRNQALVLHHKNKSSPGDQEMVSGASETMRTDADAIRIKSEELVKRARNHTESLRQAPQRELRFRKKHTNSQEADTDKLVGIESSGIEPAD